MTEEAWQHFGNTHGLLGAATLKSKTGLLQCTDALRFFFQRRLRAMRFPLAAASALAPDLAGGAIRASTSAPLDLKRSAMRATSSSERMAGRPIERAIA